MSVRRLTANVSLITALVYQEANGDTLDQRLLIGRTVLPQNIG
jgi:hypothetical protein